MAKQNSGVAISFIRELFQVGLYKRSQGRVTRQVTFAVLLVGILIASWRFLLLVQTGNFGAVFDFVSFLRAEELAKTLQSSFKEWQLSLSYLAGSLMAAAGGWASYRLVNLPIFTDFLIAVEAEMNKVSWPSRAELIVSSTVVIVVIALMASSLFGFDLLWTALFRFMGVIR